MKKSIWKVLILTLSFGLFASALVPCSALAAETGTLVLTTQDTSKQQVAASISVDGALKGTGKVTVVKITAGTHEVKFGDLAGYSIVSPRSGKKNVTVKAGKKTSVAATYKKSSSGGGVAGPQVTDIDGNVYNSVVIGAQTWMKENLKVTRYRNGDAIGTTTPADLQVSAWTSLKYQWAYNGNESNAAVYGRLYTGYAAADSRGVCPAGWHLPTDAEWTTLTDYLGGSSVAGGKMKESSGFTALPGGWRNGRGSYRHGRLVDTFDAIGRYGEWWSATEYHTTNAWTRMLYYDSYYDYNDVHRESHGKSIGFSVRCVGD
ncbi:MAG: fibrobacter succinogenes major paralogous domain-containing protein [Nitrospinae bacterium]|nr:fibrobacter succinogenes major paralogous domain-containing protein [Nitrospinota bacterium]